MEKEHYKTVLLDLESEYQTTILDLKNQCRQTQQKIDEIISLVDTLN